MNHGGLEYLRFVLQAVSEKNGPVRVVGRYAAMTTLNQSRIERNEIHVGSESQFLSDQLSDDFEHGEIDFWSIKARRVVPVLSVDVDASGEIRRQSVLFPMIVGKPGVFIGDCDQVSRSFVVEPRLPSRFTY